MQEISPVAYRVPPGRPGWVTVGATFGASGRSSLPWACYVVLAQAVDWKSYSWLGHQGDLRLQELVARAGAGRSGGLNAGGVVAGPRASAGGGQPAGGQGAGQAPGCSGSLPSPTACRRGARVG